VIARLTKEVTAAREALATLKPQAGIAAPQPVHQVSTFIIFISDSKLCFNNVLVFNWYICPYHHGYCTRRLKD
jgi:hypothetical protein